MKNGILSYEKLFALMEAEGVTKTMLINGGLHPSTVSKLSKGEVVSTDALMKLCYIFDCQLNDIATYYKSEQDKEKADSQPKRRKKFDPLTDCNYADNCMTCDMNHICRARFEVCDYYDDCKSCDVRLYCRGNHMRRKPGTIPKRQPGHKVLLDETLLKLLVDRTKKE